MGNSAAFVSDPDFTLYVGDSLDVQRDLPAESVHCCVTSPPYWGLRDYGTGTWVGGDADCDHTQRMARGDAGIISTDARLGNINPMPVDTPIGYAQTCGKCGATRIDQQLGLEPTPDEYVTNMVAVFREVRRVLRKDGTLWLNIGDSYANPSSGDGVKPKDLVGIPWRLAFALQADGWYLRSDIIWSKPNPMPESVTDRPTKAHEYLFLLTRSPRYFYDADGIREQAIEGTDLGLLRGRDAGNGDGKIAWRAQSIKTRQEAGVDSRTANVSGQRNKRSVWEIATAPYPAAHFATFPPALVEPCVKAGCPEDGVVLDPFMGSGTTAQVARRLGRRSIGIELNPEYAELCAKRLQQLSLLAEASA